MTGLSGDDQMLGPCVTAITEPKYDHMPQSQRLAPQASQRPRARVRNRVLVASINTQVTCEEG